MEKFSVLLSVYNREKVDYMRPALQSVFDQTVPPTEVVLVKDGPLTPELDAVAEEFASKYPNFKVVALPENVGLGRALNEGIKHCSYELIARMDTDDYCKKDRFARQLEAFANDPSLDVVGGWVDEFVQAPSNVTAVRRLPEKHHQIKEFAKKRCPINHPTVMYKKSAVEKAGGYQHFYLMEDYYLWCRMLLSGAKFYNIQESLIFFRTSPDMYERRGGLKYAKSEYRFFKFLYKNKFIGLPSFLYNSASRFVVRIAPNWVRRMIYLRMLRK